MEGAKYAGGSLLSYLISLRSEIDISNNIVIG